MCACFHPRADWIATETRAAKLSTDTSLGAQLVEASAQHPSLSAIYPLGSGLDAMAARIILIERAERAIDFQYYILHRDITGEWIMARLLAAADRGVRVRILVDDFGSRNLDGWMPALAVHPNVEVRYFNPFARGPWPWLARVLDVIWRTSRINHRMHNKLLTADGVGAVVGGRNIGDAYFDASATVNFADYDLFVGGPVVRELGECFDSYWNSPYAVAPEAWSELRRDESALAALRAEFESHVEQHRQSAYADRVRGTRLMEQLVSGERSYWAQATAVADLPQKVEARGEELEAALLVRRMAAHLPRPRRELLVVSPYFVPGKRGVDFLVGLARAGVRVAVLTNSLSATDVSAVHAGYKRYRRALLKGGVELYELKPRAVVRDKARGSGPFGSSGASLHAKSFVYDRERVFVGSLNLDPRSIDLNTELGVIVESAPLAAAAVASFERGISSEQSWRVSLDASGKLSWDSTENGASVHCSSDPEVGVRRRFTVWFLGLLPIENQL